MDFGFWILDFGFWILDFGSWILDFGCWILEFGFWILDQFSIRSFCGGPKRRRLDFGVWILEFGVWILDFGLDEALLDIVWILHKIFPCHADSGRRIHIFFTRDTICIIEFFERLGVVSASHTLGTASCALKDSVVFQFAIWVQLAKSLVNNN